MPEVRLVGPNGEPVGIVRIEDALRLAEEADLDLVEVAPDARPPVVKLMDYGKFKYESAMKAREARRGGDKVKVTIMFRGREQSRPELGFRLLQRLANDVTEIGYVEFAPKQDGRNMVMVLAPTKKKADAQAERKAEVARVAAEREADVERERVEKAERAAARADRS